MLSFSFGSDGPLVLRHADGFEYIGKGGIKIQRLTGNVFITYAGLNIKSDTVLNDAVAERLEFINRVSLVDTAYRELRAKRLTYNKTAHTAIATGMVEVEDTVDKLLITGEEGHYIRSGRITKLTKKPFLYKREGTGDTIKVRARHMEHFGDIKKSIATDSVILTRSGMVARAGRSEFLHRQGLITLTINPYIEYENSIIYGDTIQILLTGDTVREMRSFGNAYGTIKDTATTTHLSSDTITLYLADKKARQATLLGHARTAAFNDSDSTRTNVLAARTINYYFQENKIDSFYAYGNASALYYHDGDSGEFGSGRNETSGDSLYFYFFGKNIDRILAKGAIKGTYFGK